MERKNGRAQASWDDPDLQQSKNLTYRYTKLKARTAKFSGSLSQALRAPTTLEVENKILSRLGLL